MWFKVCVWSAGSVPTAEIYQLSSSYWILFGDVCFFYSSCGTLTVTSYTRCTSGPSFPDMSTCASHQVKTGNILDRAHFKSLRAFQTWLYQGLSGSFDLQSLLYSSRCNAHKNADRFASGFLGPRGPLGTPSSVRPSVRPSVRSWARKICIAL